MATTPPAAPLSVGVLLQRALDVFGRNAAAMVWCVVAVVVPLTVVSGAAAVLLGSGGARTYELGATLMTVVGALGGLVAVAACVWIALADQRGEPVSVGAALRFGASRYPQMLVVTLVVALAVFAGILACVVPGIYLLVRWSMAVPALLVEGRGVGDALARGWAVVENRWWLTFGLLLAGYLIPAIVAAVLQQVTVALFGLAVETRSPGGLLGLGAAQILGTCISMPFTAAFLVLLFTDLAATLPATVGPRADWPPPAAPAGPYGPEPQAWGPPPVPAPPPIPPAPPVSAEPLPGGFLPPAPEDAPRGDGLAPPPERPPGAGA